MIHDQSTAEGINAEETFLRAIKRRFSFIRKANTEEDTRKHWDYLLSNNGVEFTVDVKAHKHKWRGGPLLENYYWIEWKNVWGNKGWIDGEADFIAFFYFDKIYFYNRCELRDRAREMVNFNKQATKASEAIHCVYTRPNRKDLTSMISIQGLHAMVEPACTIII